MKIHLIVFVLSIQILATENLEFTKTKAYISSLDYNSSIKTEMQQLLVVNKKITMHSNEQNLEAGLQYLQLNDCLSQHISQDDLHSYSQSMLNDIKMSGLEEDYKYGLKKAIGWWLTTISMKIKTEGGNIEQYKNMFACNSKVSIPVTSELNAITKRQVAPIKTYEDEQIQFYLKEYTEAYRKFISAKGLVDIFHYDMEKEMSMNCIQRSIRLSGNDSWIEEGSTIRRFVTAQLTPTQKLRKSERDNTDLKWKNFYLYELNTVHHIQDELTELWGDSKLNRCMDKYTSFELYMDFLPRYIHEYSSDLEYAKKHPTKGLEEHSENKAAWLKLITAEYERLKLKEEQNKQVLSTQEKAEQTLFKMSQGQSTSTTFQQLVNIDGAHVNAKDAFGRTPLFYAVKNNNSKLIKDLLDNGAYMDYRDINNRSVFDYFSDNVSYKTRNALWLKKYTLKHPSFKEVRVTRRVGYQFAPEIESYTNKDSWTELMFAVYENNYNKLNKLIEKGVDLNAYNNNKTTALHFAVYLNNLKFMEALLDAGANIEAKNRTNLTPLFYAVENENKKAVDLLIKHGANVNALSSYRESPLSYAYHYQKLGTFDQLLSYGADINVQDKLGWTLLFEAVHKNSYADVKYLLDRGIDIDVKSKKGGRIYEIFSAETAVFIVNSLLEAYVKKHPTQKVPDSFSNYYKNLNVPISKTLVEQALSDNNMSKFKTLLNENAAEGHLDSLLFIAVYKNNGEAIQLLIDKGANIEAENWEKRTPLIAALSHSYSDAMNVLIKNGANYKTHLHDNLRPIHLAEKWGARDAIKNLVINGADSNDVDVSSGRTILMKQLSKCASVEFITFLLDHNADMTIVDNHGLNAIEILEKECKYMPKNKLLIILEERKKNTDVDM